MSKQMPYWCPPCPAHSVNALWSCRLSNNCCLSGKLLYLCSNYYRHFIL